MRHLAKGALERARDDLVATWWDFILQTLQLLGVRRRQEAPHDGQDLAHLDVNPTQLDKAAIHTAGVATVYARPPGRDPLAPDDATEPQLKQVAGKYPSEQPGRSDQSNGCPHDEEKVLPAMRLAGGSYARDCNMSDETAFGAHAPDARRAPPTGRGLWPPVPDSRWCRVSAASSRLKFGLICADNGSQCQRAMGSREDVCGAQCRPTSNFSGGASSGETWIKQSG